MHFLNLLAVYKDFKYNSKANCKFIGNHFTAKAQIHFSVYHFECIT